jgi:hypothetical protein
MKMKPHEKSLGRNPLSDAPYRNPGMVLNGQGPGRHPLGDAPYLDLDTMLNEQGSGRRILSDTLHRRPGVVKNEQLVFVFIVLHFPSSFSTLFYSCFFGSCGFISSLPQLAWD